MKGFISIIFACLLLLTACGGVSSTSPSSEEDVKASVDAPTEESVDAPTEESVDAPTEEEVEKPTATMPSVDDSTSPSADIDVACRPESIEDVIKLSPSEDIPDVVEDDWQRGNSDARITIIEYSDFQCPGCSGVAPVLKELREDMGDEMRYIFRHYPLDSIHELATIASEATEAAGEQETFWEYHDMLFEKQSEWGHLSREEAIEMFIGYAEELELDTDVFEKVLEDGKYTNKMEQAVEEARNAGLTGTPSLILNGYMFPLQQVPLNSDGISFFLNIIRLIENQYDSPEQVIDPTKEYQATVTTENGEFIIDLFPDTAPINVNSFAFLAQQGWYDDVTFHRVLPGFMAQGGDPSGTGMGWPGYRCDDEVSLERGFDKAGMVAMANSGPNTNSAQFFITYGPTPHLNDGFTIIGEVVSGKEIVDAITPRDPEMQPDFEGDTIISIVVTEK